MRRHVELLGYLFSLWGVFNGVVGAALVAFGTAAFLLVPDARRSRPGTELAAGAAGATLVFLGAAAIFWAALHLWCGPTLKRHRRSARTFGLVLAALNLSLPPFGTALGGYGLWVLLSDDARRSFEEPPPIS